MQTLPADRQERPHRPVDSARSARRALAAAFASFTQTAGALETTYSNLHGEVCRLRYELENKNRVLAQSLDENQRMRTYLTRILEGLPCGVLVFDAKLNLRVVNPAAARLLSADNQAHASVPEILGPMLAALPPGTVSHEQEWTVRGSEGEQPVGITRACFHDGDSGEESILILRDLTETKQLESERENSRRAQALAEVAALLAHEIRNPLGSLELFAGLLADALRGQEELQTWINHVQAGLRSLAATVNNVLHFHTRPSAQRVPVDLVHVLGQTVDFLRPLARQKEMLIQWQAPPYPMAILADPSRLQQAFLNLTLNAFRAMKPGGSLRLSICAAPEVRPAMATVVFADQGKGISARDLEKIFEPGFTTRPGSPGLGLAVTRQVVEQHGGSIRVASQAGEGTTFTLTLPLAGQPPDREIG